MNQHNTCVLVVEDDKQIRNFICYSLETEGFKHIASSNGQGALSILISQPVDLMLLDLGLPDFDGMAVIRKVREWSEMPIIVVSARDQDKEKAAALDLGADDYLTKPFAFVELVARVKALSRRPKKRTAQVLKHQDLLLDTSNFQLSRAGQEIQLSRKEFALLAFLLSHKGKTVTKEQIISHVWDYEADILPNTVEVFIGFLRKKIDKPFAKKKKLIETVRGFGYRIR